MLIALLVAAGLPTQPVIAGPLAAAEPLVGYWQGAMTRDRVDLPVSVEFAATPALAGRFTSLTQRAIDYPLDTVTADGSGVHFVLDGNTVFDGQRSGDALSGHFKDDTGSGTFTLRRVPAPVLPYRVEAVTFRNGDVTLAGTLVEPRGDAKHPAVVLLQGSGPETRWGTNRYIADRFARAGIAALIYDKRGSGASTGDWKTADYDDLARDALAAVDLLARRPEIDARRIGLHGHSQGGIVAPNAARLAAGRIAFLVAEDTVGGPVWQQDLFRVDGALKARFPPDQAEAAMALYRLFIDVALGRRPYDELEAAETAAGGAPWFEWLGLPRRDSWLWPWYRKTGAVDTLDYWQVVRVPTLLAYGQRDALLPVDDSLESIEAVLDRHGTPYTAVIVPRAEHNLTVHPQPGEPFFWWHAAPGFYDLVAAWVNRTVGDGGAGESPNGPRSHRR
jgi:dienelactone hydrolase